MEDFVVLTSLFNLARNFAGE